MKTLRALRDAIVGVFRDGPDLLAEWLERKTAELDEWTGRNR